MERFTGSNAPVDRYDPRIGVLLSVVMGTVVDYYQVGFWNIGQVNLLTLHTLHTALIFCAPGCQDQYICTFFWMSL